MAKPFSTFLLSSLDAIRREAPLGHAAICEHLGDREASVSVDAEACYLLRSGPRIDVRSTPRSPVTWVRTTRPALGDLLEGRATLLEAISSDRFELRGKLEDLAAFHEAFVAYFLAAARCPSFPALLTTFLEG